jgi:hypothetical protein
MQQPSLPADVSVAVARASFVKARADALVPIRSAIATATNLRGVILPSLDDLTSMWVTNGWPHSNHAACLLHVAAELVDTTITQLTTYMRDALMTATHAVVQYIVYVL